MSYVLKSRITGMYMKKIKEWWDVSCAFYTTDYRTIEPSIFNKELGHERILNADIGRAKILKDITTWERNCPRYVLKDCDIIKIKIIEVEE